MAQATLRTFASVKSSSITPRHPSVPNLIVFTVQQYMRCRRRRKEALKECEALKHFRLVVAHFNYNKDASFSPSSHFTILPTSWARSRGQSSKESSVSTTTRS